MTKLERYIVKEFKEHMTKREYNKLVNGVFPDNIKTCIGLFVTADGVPNFWEWDVREKKFIRIKYYVNEKQQKPYGTKYFMTEHFIDISNFKA